MRLYTHLTLAAASLPKRRKAQTGLEREARGLCGAGVERARSLGLLLRHSFEHHTSASSSASEIFHPRSNSSWCGGDFSLSLLLGVTAWLRLPHVSGQSGQGQSATCLERRSCLFCSGAVRAWTMVCLLSGIALSSPSPLWVGKGVDTRMNSTLLCCALLCSALPFPTHDIRVGDASLQAHRARVVVRRSTCTDGICPTQRAR